MIVIWMSLFIIGHPCHSPRIYPFLLRFGGDKLSLSSFVCFVSWNLNLDFRLSISLPSFSYFTDTTGMNHFSVRIHILFLVLLTVHGKDCKNCAYFCYQLLEDR